MGKGSRMLTGRIVLSATEQGNLGCQVRIVDKKRDHEEQSDSGSCF